MSAFSSALENALHGFKNGYTVRVATYDFGQVVQLTGAPRIKVQRWCDAEIIRTAGGGSQGKRREFSFRNVVEIAVCNDLRVISLAEPGMRSVINSLNAIWDQPEEPLFPNQPKGKKYRDASHLWLAVERFEVPEGLVGNRDEGNTFETLSHYPVTPEMLTTRAADDVGIAIPIARIVANLERATGDRLS